MEGAVAPACEFGSSFSVLYFQLLYPFIESPSLQTGRLRADAAHRAAAAAAGEWDAQATMPAPSWSKGAVVHSLQ